MNSSSAKRMNESLSDLLIQGDIFTRKMAIEKKRIEEIQDSINEVGRQVGKYQKDIKANAVDVINLHRDQKTNVADGWNPIIQGEVSHQKLVTNLESRLNKVLVRLNQTENENLKIKKSIDQLRRNRSACDANRKKLEAGLRAKQERVGRLLESSGVLQEEHNEIIRKQEAYVEDNKEEALECVDECERLGKYIEEQNEIVSKNVKEAAHSAARGNENADNFRGDFDDAEENEMRRKLTLTNEEIARNRNSSEDTQHKIDAFEDGFAKLRVAAKQAALDASVNRVMTSRNLDDIEEIKKLFIENQDEVFSVVKYIQEVIKETDAMNERAETIENEFKSHKQKMEDEEAERAENIREFHQKIARSKEEISANTTSISDSQRVIDMLAKKVQRLFYKIQCDQVGGGGGNAANKPGTHGKHQTDSQLLLAGGGGVNESNILKFMQIIEKRAVELIADYSKMAHREDEDLVEELTCCNSSNEYIRTIKPPDSHAESDEDEFDNEKPVVVSLDEIHERTASVMSQPKSSMKRIKNKKSAKSPPKSTVFLTEGDPKAGGYDQFC